MTPEQRLAAFRDALARRPDDPFARYSVAMALRSAGDSPGAVAEFRETTRRAPDYVPSYLMLGQVLEDLGRHREALAAFEEGMAAAQRRGDGHAEAELRSAADAVRTRGNTP
ncbi:MAG TPA: tetratricopeptide repeat protein [Anaeromyxobacter sp.]|nr:tetratricopeptide repeat protein [Anaeromyxobacter sp.]